MLPADITALKQAYPRSKSDTFVSRTKRCEFGNGDCMDVSSKCSSEDTFRFFLHDSFINIKEEKYLHRLLEGSRFRTENQEEACISVAIPPLSHRSHSPSFPSGNMVSAYLRSLPNWNQGRNHLIFHLGDTVPTYDTDSAMIASTAFLRNWSVYLTLYENLRPGWLSYRDGYDISIPSIFTSVSNSSVVESNYFNTFSGKYIPPNDGNNRKYLLSQVGNVEFVGPYHPTFFRLWMNELNDSRVASLAFCEKKRDGWHQSAVFKKSCLAAEKRSDALLATFDSPDSLYLNSQFMGITPGIGGYGTQIVRALHAGAIPILICEVVPPFVDLINWSVASVVWGDFTPTGITKMVSGLQEMSPPTVADVSRNGRIYANHYFSSAEVVVDNVFISIIKRYERFFAFQSIAVPPV